MSVYRPQSSPYFHFDFQLRGVRFHGSTRCGNKRQAQEVEKAERAKAKERVKTDRRALRLTIDAAAGRYWTEVGQHHACGAETWINLERLVGYFGKDKLLDEITDDQVAQLVACGAAIGVGGGRHSHSSHQRP
jgi:hypothetical protein